VNFLLTYNNHYKQTAQQPDLMDEVNQLFGPKYGGGTNFHLGGSDRSKDVLTSINQSINQSKKERKKNITINRTSKIITIIVNINLCFLLSLSFHEFVCIIPTMLFVITTVNVPHTHHTHTHTHTLTTNQSIIHQLSISVNQFCLCVN